MSLQFVLGSSGAGKSHYIYDRIIQESMKNPDINYILLVPEQYSMLLQRKMVMLHPRGGTTNIDVIGFNRLAYRIFDELNVKPASVLEDFGKSMLIRQVAGEVSDRLSVYGGSLDKSGFIDEVKSLMSEMYQYDISREKLKNAIEKLKEQENGKKSLLRSKLEDMVLIFQEFEKRMHSHSEKEYMVAEQLTELLAARIDESELIKKSVIVLDGFTGFTPIQRKVVGKLLLKARKVYGVFTVDEEFYKQRRAAKEHELFYLTGENIRMLKELAESQGTVVEEDIYLALKENRRWKKGSSLMHLERNLFRYPYQKYEEKPEEIRIFAYDTLRSELEKTAYHIFSLVQKENYRYGDIAVIGGNLEQIAEFLPQVFPKYRIPFFLDYSRPVKNNPFTDAIGHALKILEDNFSYESVFAFLKSGVADMFSYDESEKLENYVLAHRIRGIAAWRRKWEDETDETRSRFMELMLPLYEKLVSGEKKKTVRVYIEGLRILMENLGYEWQIKKWQETFLRNGDYARAKLYDMLFAKIEELFEKLLEIMPDEEMPAEEFHEILDLGFKDLSMGMIPTNLDMVIVGDITRTRLDGIKVLFILNVNDGVIPKRAKEAQIISDREKEKLAGLGLMLAPTEKVNAFAEQFYLYQNMTKPSERLYLSYIRLSGENEPMRPSYILDRVGNLFPKLQIEDEEKGSLMIGTREASEQILAGKLRKLLDGTMEKENRTEALTLYRLFLEEKDEALLALLSDALTYQNIPKKLSKDVADLIRIGFLSQSVSRLERYANCAYSYFLQYTLGLRERENGSIDQRKAGTILHAAMEKMYRHVHDHMENDWTSMEDTERDLLMENFVKHSFAEEYGEELTEEGRYEYLQNMLVRVGKRTAKVLCDITEQDEFAPEYFEYHFSSSVKLSSSGETMTLKGIVDRGDIYVSPETDSLRLRIIDYKSGNYDFKISQLYEGLQLQLAVYMNMMQELVESEYNKNLSEDEKISVFPEGMYYYRMQDPYVEAYDNALAEEERTKKFVLKGLANDGSRRFEDIISFAMKKVKELAEEIIDGEIRKYPVIKDGKSVCEYCVYSAVCRFDEKSGGNRYHYMRFKENRQDKERAYEAIAEELGGERDGLDKRTAENH